MTLEISGQYLTFYVDQAAEVLTGAVDLSSFRGIYNTTLQDHVLERQLAPYVIFPRALDAVVGIAQSDHMKAQLALNNIPWPLDQDGLVHLRQVALLGAGGFVLFPTAALFAAFGFKRQAQNPS